MSYEEFRLKFKKYPIITGKLLRVLGVDSPGMNINLQRWERRKKLVRLRRGVYVLNAADAQIKASRAFLAQEIYNPSYLSLEYALSVYGLIPERVADMTSVTTKKTMSFKNAQGTFAYRHIKVNAFSGFVMEKDEAGLGFYIAKPEKALVDFVYLNQHQPHSGEKAYWLESFRLQNLESLDFAKMREYVALFENAKLEHIMKKLLEP